MNDATAHVFFDGQNFYRSAKAAFGIGHPDFDPVKLTELFRERIGHDGRCVSHFYTGMPVERYSPKWFRYWTSKIEAMRADGVEVVTRPLRYLTETDPASPTGFRVLGAREKGIDMRIALDMLRAAIDPRTAHVVLVSRDQDFVEVMQELHRLGRAAARPLGLWSAFPRSPRSPDHIRGVDGTREIVLDAEDYRRCRDLRDHLADPAAVPVPA